MNEHSCNMRNAGRDAFGRTSQLLLTVLCAWSMLASIALADGPLHEEVDRHIAEQAGGALAARCTDAEFVRRIWLDLAGVIPTADEARAFLADADPQKREKLIDRLLAAPEYPRRMQEAVTVMLLERRSGNIIPDPAWRAYLQQSFAANKPWDALVRELIAADGKDEATRPALRLFDAGRGDAHELTQDFARLFLGFNWKCAQCHDHPTIHDYEQAHYYGLYAYLSSTKLHVSEQKQPFLIDGVTMAKFDFVSVFKPDDKRATGPKLLEGGEVVIPTFAKGEEFATPPGGGLPGIPKFQPRPQLAEPLTAHRQFARNAANRFWFLMLGRGLVHPLDLHHSENPPSHPALLERLTDEFIAHRFDVKWLLRELALSETYQRSGVLPDGIKAEDVPAASFRVLVPRPLSAEQMARSLAEALGQRERLDQAQPAAETKFNYKDYANGRLAPPDNWPDVLTLFAAAFGHPAGQPEDDFRPSVEQSLFLENDRLVQDWLADRPESITTRLAAIESPAALVEELTLRLYSRLPTAEEQEHAAAFLQSGAADRSSAIRDLCWAAIMATEFRLTH